MEKELIKGCPPWLILIILGGVGGGVGCVNSDENYTATAFLVDVFTGGFVSFLVGMFLWTGHLHPYVIFTMCGVSAIFSKEALRLLRRKVFKYLNLK